MNTHKSKSPEELCIPTNDIFFTHLAENITQVMFFVEPETYTIQYLNRLQPGFKMEDVIGTPMFHFVSPDHIDLYNQKLNTVKATGKSEVIEVIGMSTQRADGKAWYRTKITPIKNASGNISSIMFISDDITESKLNEIENINQGERIKAIINNTGDIICSIDLSYNIIEFNSVFSEMVKRGYGISMQSGDSVLNYIDPTKHEHLISIYKRVEQGETCHDIQKFGTVTGNFVYNESSYHPIYDLNKKIIGISIFSKDITERVKSEQKIINTLKEKEVLLAEIHHRIKNNLAMVSSLLQLQEMNISNTEAKDALAISRKRIKSTALIHELLYKSESFQNINFNEYLSELFQHLNSEQKIQLNLTGQDVSLDLATALPLGLMLNEIMLNSFKHSYIDAKDGKTDINMRSENNLLKIDYCDCKGVFPENVDFKNSTTTGLTLIQTFAQQLNGEIELICKAPPKYSISIPLNETR